MTSQLFKPFKLLVKPNIWNFVAKSGISAGSHTESPAPKVEITESSEHWDTGRSQARRSRYFIVDKTE